MSGDFFHVLPLDNQRTGILICDVMGHGVRSALITAMMRVLAQEAVQPSLDAGPMLSRVNRGLMEILSTETGLLFVTAVYAIVDVERRVVHWGSAGHPAPLLLRRTTAHAEFMAIPRSDFNPALGIFPQADFHTYERSLEPSDVLLFYTDGQFEVENAVREQLGMNGFQAEVQALANTPLSELVPAVLKNVQTYGARGFEDDVCLLAAELDSRT